MNELNFKISSLKSNIVNSTNKSNNKSVTTFLIIGCGVLLIMLLLILIYRFMDNELEIKYDNIKNYYDDDKNLDDPCPEGCDMGLCIQKEPCYNPFPPNPECCAFDSQCRHCKDKSGIIIDTDAQTVRDSIRNRYYKQYDSVSELNADINDENKYIGRLNKQIRKRNKDYLGITSSIPKPTPKSSGPKPSLPKPSVPKPLMPKSSTATNNILPPNGSDEILEQKDTGQQWTCVKPYSNDSDIRSQLAACEFGMPVPGKSNYNDRETCISNCKIDL